MFAKSFLSTLSLIVYIFQEYDCFTIKSGGMVGKHGQLQRDHTIDPKQNNFIHGPVEAVSPGTSLTLA